MDMARERIKRTALFLCLGNNPAGKERLSCSAPMSGMLVAAAGR